PVTGGGGSGELSKSTTRPLPTLPDRKSRSGGAGFPPPEKTSTWVARVAPAGTPAAIIGKIHREIARIHTDTALRAKLEKLGIELAVSASPPEFDAFIRRETDRWSKVLKESGNLKLD